MNTKVKEDLESLSKNVYLESPDLWIDFVDKVNNEIIDEMVLFFAAKYDYISIIQYVLNNNVLDMKSKSKNSSFKDIYDHLLHTSKQSNSTKVYNFLASSDDDYTEIENESEETTKKYELPSFICTSCNSNLFECGYIVCESKTYKFSKEENKPIEVSSEILDTIKCCKCSSIVSDATPNKLNSLCNITNCSNCSFDLRKVGIKNDKKLNYDQDSNTFISNGTHYTCHACNTPLTENQRIHFNLI